jgi:hypothetical protein
MTTTLSAKPRFWTRRWRIVWVLVAILLFVGGLLLRERVRDAHTAATIERVNRLGGSVLQFREEIGWQSPFRGISLIESLLGRTAMSVNLQKTAPTLDDLREVAALPNLRDLDLSDAAGIDDVALEIVSDSIGIGVLTLSGIGVTDDGAKHLAGHSRLWALMLDDTKVTDEGVAALRPAVAKVISVRGANVTAVAGEGVTVSTPVRSGEPLTVTGRVFVREIPPGGRIVLTAVALRPGERTSRADVGRINLTARTGWQDFSLPAMWAWDLTGRLTLEIVVYVGGAPYVIYRVAQIPIDVLSAEGVPPAKGN